VELRLSAKEFALLICAANDGPDIGAFGIEDESRTLRFRATIPADRDGSIQPDSLLRVTRDAVSTTARSLPRWREVLASSPERSLLLVPSAQSGAPAGGGTKIDHGPAATRAS
jgi:hypothetical protein